MTTTEIWTAEIEPVIDMLTEDQKIIFALMLVRVLQEAQDFGGVENAAFACQQLAAEIVFGA